MAKSRKSMIPMPLGTENKHKHGGTEMKRRIIAALIALLLLSLALMSLSLADIGTKWTVPDGYNEHDYNKVAAFLEIEDESGVKNGEKLNGSDYDPNDPETWGTCMGYDEDWNYGPVPCFAWTQEGDELRLRRIYSAASDLYGFADFSDCTSLLNIELDANRLTGLILSGCVALDSVVCSNNDLAELDVSGCTVLRSLWVQFNELNEIGELPQSLRFLMCGNNNISELDMSNTPLMTVLDCSENPNLTSINVANCSGLQILSGWQCDLTELDLSNCSGITSLQVHQNNITELDVTNCPNLIDLYCFNNNISELDVTNCPELALLWCSNNNIETLDLQNCSKLLTLNCSGNELDAVDLSGNPNLPLELVQAEGSGTVAYYFDVICGTNNALVYAAPSSGSEFAGWYNEAGELISEQEVFDFNGIIETETVLIARFDGGAALPGDVDGDSEVDAFDAMLVLRSAMGLIDLMDEQLAAADMNGDGNATAGDAIIILRTAMGLI